MKLSVVLVASLLLLSLIGSVAAVSNYSNTFSDTDVVRINQSLAQDPTSDRASPWDLWVPSGFLGIGLVILALIKPKLYRMDYEVNIILSVLAWPFLWYFTWGALTSIDKVIGVGAASSAGTGAAVFITQHILYTFPTLGWIGVAGDLAAVFITVILVAQFNLFKESEENAKVQNVS